MKIGAIIVGAIVVLGSLALSIGVPVLVILALGTYVFS